jgi:hypothetical protein
MTPAKKQLRKTTPLRSLNSQSRLARRGARRRSLRAAAGAETSYLLSLRAR